MLNEEAGIVAFLNALSPHLRPGDEIVVADGGSDDKTVSLAQPLAHRIVSAPQGRAKQMNAGAEKAQGDVFVFLHADTQLSPEGLNAADLAVRRGAVWGRFDISLSGTQPRLLRLVEKVFQHSLMQFCRSLFPKRWDQTAFSASGDRRSGKNKDTELSHDDNNPQASQERSQACTRLLETTFSPLCVQCHEFPNGG